MNPLDWLINLISPDAMEELIKLYPWHFVFWSALVFFLGYQFGKRKAGFITFYDLNKRQRQMLASMRGCPIGPIAIDRDVMDLLDHGLIGEVHGYDVITGSSPKEFSVTIAGRRMLRFHPITWRLVARAKGGAQCQNATRF